MPELLQSCCSQGLRWALADVVVDPWRPASAAGRVFGGIRPFPSIPEYFHERRSERGEALTMNRHSRPQRWGKGQERCDELAYYLGPLHRHFGHAIVESSTRLWFYRQARDQLAQGKRLPLVILPPADTREHLNQYGAAELSTWQRDLLGLYGVPIEALRFVRSPLRCTRLIVPEQAWLWGARPTPDAVAACACAPGAGGGSRTERLVLVRGDAYFRKGAVAGEGVIRSFFAAHCYRLLDPLSLSLPEQVALLGRASQVFGVQGSAFHLLNLAGNRTVRVGCLGRVGTLATRGFINSLEPCVGSLLLQRPDGSLQPPGSGARGTKSRLALHRDLPRLLHFLIRFDPDLRPERFDGAAYARAVESDTAAFLAEGSG